jgi:hypothetical protein
MNISKQAGKVKTLETFGPDLDFETIKNCIQSQANHTIGAKHIKILAEEGLVHVKYDRDAKEGTRQIINFHETLTNEDLV